MGIFGTYGAFSGLGKPSIKLEFEDNDELLAFQQRMQEQDGGNDDPDGGNFTPSTYTQEQLDNAVKNHTVTGWGIFPEIPDGWQLVKTSAAPKGFDVITKGEPSFKMTTEGWKFKHSLDAALIEKKKGLKVVKDDEEPVEGVKQNKEAFLKEIYSYTEKLTPKEFSYSLLEKELGKDKDGVYTIVTPVFPVYFRRERLFERNQHILNHIGKNFNVIKRTLEDPYIIFESVDKNNIPCIDFVKCFKVKDKKILVIFSAIDPKTFNVSTIFEPDDPDEYVWEKYIKGRERRLYTRNASVSECYTSKIDGLDDTSLTFKAVNFCLPCIITENGTKSCVDGAKNSLGAPGDTYIITDTRTRARKDLEDTAALKKYDIRKFSGEELQKMQTDDPLLYEQIKSDLGKTANNVIYNDNSIIDCRGLVPTYRQLANYDRFFDTETVKNSQNFAGFGLDDTLKLIDETCRNHWKDCAKIAQHLKGDCKLQSAFNLWHWMRHNIRYEYDREGREEVRTPLRVWKDRHSGVDCDCLSVFAYCVLKCMGYNPQFELVAFHGKPQFAHIYVTLDGIIIDRVWYVFNSRPPGVTKRMIHKVADVDSMKFDLGRLFN